MGLPPKSGSKSKRKIGTSWCSSAINRPSALSTEPSLGANRLRTKRASCWTVARKKKQDNERKHAEHATTAEPCPLISVLPLGDERAYDAEDQP